MKNTLQLSITNPCHENWDNFTPTTSGGFCGSCQKNVRDFTQMSDTELIAYFRNAASKQSESLCGRFRDNQLQTKFDINQWFPEWIIEENQLFYEIPVEKLSNKSLRIDLPSFSNKHFIRNSIAAMLILSFSVNAQKTTITGKITDANDGSGLPGVSIQIIGTQKGTISNTDGEYKIEVEKNQKLRFGFVGYETQEIKVEDSPNINLKMEGAVMGEVVVTAHANTMGKYSLGGYISVISSNICTIESTQEKLPQPERLSIYPNIARTNDIFLQLEPLETEDGTKVTAFGKVEKLEVYDYYTGKNFKISYDKEPNGELKLDISRIPNGLYVVRLLQKNETDIEKPIVSIARLVIER
ncbi:MAG: carboxypeptidase-like regulatory domain-containing protein [Emticicia sp.]|uniref:carboxypeptidase-like regulatory domain-containing protein n=1 Tax=Emticicia sp. TaxID=1930953 RepID=UPI003BA745CB